jgi:uncharacterized OB-fold protein
MSADEGTRSTIDSALAEAVAAGQAVIAHCSACDYSFWHPRAHCPRCGAREVGLVAPAGPARVYAATVNRRPRGGEDADPVQLGYIEFPERVRMLVPLRFADGIPVIGAEVAPERDGEGDSARLVFRPIPRE